MKRLLEFREFRGENITPEYIVLKYCNKYPEYSDFFNHFLEIFPNENSYQTKLLNDYREDNYSLNAEINMLNNEIGEVPDNDIWTHFKNDLETTNWNN